MKHHLLIIVFALMLVSCATSKKVHETVNTSIVETETVQEAAKHESERVVDTTRTEHGKVVITEIIFDTNTPEASTPDTRASPDADSSNQDKRPPAASVELPGIGKISGNIKSIRQTILENEVEQKGESKESEKQEESKCNASVLVAEESHDVISQPAPDPKRWRYIFYILAIGVVILLYLKRTPILEWLRRILSGLRHIFSK